MKSILRCIVLICLLGISQVAVAQKMDRVQGDILLSLDVHTNLHQFVESHRLFKGMPTSAKLVRKVSKHMNIWLIHIDYNHINEVDFLATIRRDDRVQIAQFNHLVSSRQTFPNDGQFSSQWHWFNDGSNGGTADADVDAELAWDIATGGLTASGDEIVVAALDDGTDLDHPDLADNHWVNEQEIPNNGVDDDGNGYVDDYNGWSIITNDDDVDNGSHGVNVNGMIGAIGNNDLGVTGMNWNTKIMTVKNNFNTEEARVLEAYSYPLTMRKMYNESNGQKGAFVVATNASWGIDFGDPEDAPLWCAFYDTLGVQGVLNCGATSNQGINIDVEGDLPTACPSDYMIAVTRTGNADQQGGGFGIVQIDLGAPGINVFTTDPGGGYGSTTGTSFASPLVAGVIGLMYSAPCSNLANLAKANPSEAALLIRQYLLEGVDKIDGYENLVATGGRVNAFNSLQLIMDNCGPCPAPAGLSTDDVTDVEATLSWTDGDSTLSTDVRWRAIGEPDWTDVINATSPLNLENLMACTEYEWQIKAICTDTISEYSKSLVFKTDGCCEAPGNLNLSVLSDAEAAANWSSILAAESYNIRIRPTNTNDWESFNTTATNYDFDDLDACTPYEVQVQTVCDTGATAFTPSVLFSTFGCGACIDSSYCESAGEDPSAEWLESITVHDLTNESGLNDGYIDYTGTNLTTTLSAGFSYPISLTPGFNGFTFDEVFRLWIDLNQDGEFDNDNELLFESSPTETTVTGTIDIPSWVGGGFTRMRISMAYNSAPGSCGNFDFGEVEDYCVTIDGGNGCFPPLTDAMANFDGTVELRTNAPDTDYERMEYRYRLDGSLTWTGPFLLDDGSTLISDALEECEEYDLEVRTICADTLESPWILTDGFKTKGCGACLDFEYCESSGVLTDFEYIEKVRLAAIDFTSGDDDGYGNFTEGIGPATTNLAYNGNYEIELTPGYNFGNFEVYFNVWIDFDQNGVFTDPGENVYTSSAATEMVVGSFTLPPMGELGVTRLRIGMSETAAPMSCDQITYGEVEDYCVVLTEALPPCNAPELTLDNVTNTTASLSWTPTVNSVGYNLRMRELNGITWTDITTNDPNHTFEDLTFCTEYEVQIRSICAAQNSGYSNSFNFTTGCETSSREVAGLEKVLVLPNPFNEQFVIQLELSAPIQLDIKLYHSNGQLVQSLYQGNSPNGQQQIAVDIANQPAGLYWLLIQTEEGTQVQKLIKQ
ncbi:MAG: GEVED domain-containing protein [Bacteroidota bacterium]